MTPATLQQYHLTGRGHSGRGVRFRHLSASELAQVQVDAARMANGEDTTPMAYRTALFAEALSRIVVATTPPKLKGIHGDAVTWTRLKRSELLFEDGGWSRHFTAKDTSLLRAWYASNHEIDEAFVEHCLNGTRELVGMPDDVLHLAGLPGLSGRVVRIRTVDAALVRVAQDRAAAEVGREATQLEYRNALLHIVVPRMIAEVSEPGVKAIPGKDKDGQALLPVVAMDKAPELDWGPTWDATFSAQDTSLLEAVYATLHEVSGAELDMLSGKALPVSSEDDPSTTGGT